MKLFYPFLLLVIFIFNACQQSGETSNAVVWEPYDESQELEKQKEHEVKRMHFKLIQSKVSDRNAIWTPFEKDLAKFSEMRYQELKPLILGQNIIALQNHIKTGALTYEDLTLFFIYRIRKFESNKDTYLNAIISLNPEVVKQARERDMTKSGDDHLIFGMPILFKDNINAIDMPTTAGAIALTDNKPGDAFIIQKLKNKGGLVLGKTNLSEWAYFFCKGCPVGYSAIGGQTLNPYGRKIFETGGSSSGSGAAMAANYAVATVGTETAGSILSPSSKNSLVGLKPTVGVLSRSGIVPISSTLDTPGPMTANVVDNAILLSVMQGRDEDDVATYAKRDTKMRNLNILNSSLKGMRLGVQENFLKNKNYQAAVTQLEKAGAELVTISLDKIDLKGFVSLLNIDMKHDLPKYLQQHYDDSAIKGVQDVVDFNKKDSLIRMPYNQGIFDGILADTLTVEELNILKGKMKTSARTAFNNALDTHDLQAILSINNYNAAVAAVAIYPCLTLPMGYTEKNEPIGITLIGKPFSEALLYEIGIAVENVLKARKQPKDFE